MGYVDFIKKTTSEKIVLIEMDLGKDQKHWYNYQAGVWAYKWRQIQYIKNIGDGNIGDGNIGDGAYGRYIKIGSCFADGEEYTKKNTLNDCIANEKSWYYDSINYIFYIHCIDNDEPQIHHPIIGITLGLSNRGGYFNDLYYESRLKDLMTFNKTKDPFYFGIIRHDGGEMSFINNDGFFDDFTSNVIFGQPVVSKFGGDNLSYADFSTINKSYIEDLSLNPEKMSVVIVDNKKKLSLSLPINKYDKTTYPNLLDDDIGKAIPLGYGEIYHAPVICVNAAQTGTPDRVFKLCDVSKHTNGIEDIIQIYKITDGVPVAVSSFTKQLTDGTATITNTDWDSSKKYIADFKGVKNSGDTYLQNPLDIIADILAVFLLIIYDTTNYNTTEWVAARAHDLANNIGLFIDDEMEICEIIEKICGSITGNFIIMDDGKYTYRILNVDQEPKKTIYLEDMIDDFQIEWAGAEFLSSANVGYKKDWSKKTYRWYLEDSERDQIVAKYKKHNDGKFETLLTNETDAIKLATALMSLFKDIHPNYVVMTKTDNVDSEIMDILNLQINRVNKPWLDYIKTELVGIVKDLVNNITTLTAWHIVGFTGFFFGIRLLLSIFTNIVLIPVNM